MGDERYEIGSNVVAKGNIENQCSMSSNNNNIIPSITHHFTTNATNNNNNNNEKKDQFLHLTNTVNSFHHFSTNGSSSNNNNDDEQEGFFPISSTSNTNPFTGNSSNNSSSSNNNNSSNEQYHFLPISSNNNIQHSFSNATTKRNKNKEQDWFLPISTKACSSSSNTCNDSNKEQDRFLPIANVGRIMKKFIPGNGKISKDAKATVQECVSEFISFVTGEAAEKCQREKRKTINGDDIIWAMTVLGFDDYVNPLKQYLNKHRELELEKLNLPKQQRFQRHDQKPDMSYHTVYSSTGLLSQPSFLPNDQSFPFPFSQNPIQTQFPEHEHIDSTGNW